jgi:hypothetical protein
MGDVVPVTQRSFSALQLLNKVSQMYRARAQLAEDSEAAVLAEYFEAAAGHVAKFCGAAFTLGAVLLAVAFAHRGETTSTGERAVDQREHYEELAQLCTRLLVPGLASADEFTFDDCQRYFDERLTISLAREAADIWAALVVMRVQDEHRLRRFAAVLPEGSAERQEQEARAEVARLHGEQLQHEHDMLSAIRVMWEQGSGAKLQPATALG